MPKVEWADLQARAQAAHLLVATLVDDEDSVAEGRAAERHEDADRDLDRNGPGVRTDAGAGEPAMVSEAGLHRGTARIAHTALRRLCATLAQGSYALAIHRADGRVELRCAFDRADDAQRIGAVLEAQPIVAPGPWASALAVAFDEAAHRRAEQAAGPQRRRARRSPVAAAP